MHVKGHLSDVPAHLMSAWHDKLVILTHSLLHHTQVVNLKRILLSISQETITQMQSEIESVYKHLTWNDPPQPYDAFHSILFQLWQKRYIRRKHVMQTFNRI